MARLVVIGPGAIGGVLAALAHERGHDVALAVRTPFDVLRVRTGADGEEREVPAAVHTDPADLGPADWVVLTTKAHHTASAADWLKATTGPGSVVVVAQNGVDQERRVEGLVHPDATAVPAVVVLGAEAVEPGRIVHHGYGRLTVPDGPWVDGLAALVGGGDDGVEVAGSTDYRTDAWRKLISNAVANPITALTMRRNEVLAEDHLADLVLGLSREVVAVGRAEGADISDDDVTALRRHYATMPAGTGTSMLYDRLAGRPTEHEYLSGAVVAAGARHGVPTPLNATMLALLRSM
ncbi:2-dehydropantoate 2-reductase [Actinomycetospora sp. TBRC 11914]|uniref:2-dehydropantoate 2-reductase n=1 Tax=Actinomycetospora sp. TBRC 11914 TaxID=2729387 RepID=UPI00145C6504|nr:2-dehydropantoate 2-reductase [Actinomycetospora sp. TBRC 11914]NMO90412.1 2-dehydropantoate 2-reductase [Actinomycetospora sp. TBRC 11914]